MVQEIITYAIVALAVVFAFRKSVKKFSRKKRPYAKEVSETNTPNAQHKCSDCTAECILRDTVSPAAKNTDTLCKRINISSD